MVDLGRSRVVLKNQTKLQPALKCDGQRPWVVGFLLPPKFILLSYAAAIEPLRAANCLARRELYRWRNISVDGRLSRAAVGPAVKVRHRVGDDLDLDLLLICSSSSYSYFRDKTTFSWLRKLARRGTAIGGIAGGIHIMARAGLLEGRRCAVHWAQTPEFLEEFPGYKVENSLYVIDGNRITCSGGIAPLDLMHAIIELHHGHGLASAVGNWFIHDEVRPESGSQRASLRIRSGVSNESVLRAMAAMEKSLEQVLERERIAAIASVSLRQLERLFQFHLGTTISRYYLGLRLNHAQHLLQKSSRSVTEVAIAVGFSSLSYFSRAYKSLYGYPPVTERRRT